ncbi:uncharacterized protein [Antedon mediterranea]|uniref:uncharacterized protein n=1 Tax=Antedon mediterranea TaxID=105859 RepID=UPI003AF91D64
MESNVLSLVGFCLMVMMAASQICTESETAPSCTGGTTSCICEFATCIPKTNPCPDQQNLTLPVPMFGIIPSYAFESYKSLRYLEISSGIVNTVSNKAFWGLSNLIALNLRDNLMTGFTNATFEGLESLRQLDLSGNVISDFDDGSFSSMKNIRVLKLERNIATTVMSSTFAGCQRLEYLDLTSNTISHIEGGAFNELQNLKELHLGDNYLTTSINPTVFSGLTSLKYLMLNGNFLQGIHPGSFNSLVNIRGIDLSQNQISIIPMTTFGSLKKLETLILNSNQIGSIYEKTFVNLTSLTTLHLSWNELTSWSFLDFPTPSNLKDLFLSGNRISELLVPTHSPKPRFTKLQYLDLSRNSLSTFPAFFLNDAPILGHSDGTGDTSHTKLDLRDNFLDCDCDYRVLNRTLEQLAMECVGNYTECTNASVTFLPSMNRNIYYKVSGSPLPVVECKDSNDQIATGIYNVSARITWLSADTMDVDTGSYTCMIYEDDSRKADTMETSPTDSSSYTLPSFTNIITLTAILILTK